MYRCISWLLAWTYTVSTLPIKILQQYYWQMQCNCKKFSFLIQFTLNFVVGTIIPQAFAHSTYWKSHINNTVWQNIGTKVFLIFIQYTEPAAINKSKRLIKYLNSLNRIAKKRGLLQSVPAFHHIHVPRWTYGTTFYFSSRRNDPHKFRSWIDNSVNL